MSQWSWQCTRTSPTVWFTSKSALLCWLCLSVWLFWPFWTWFVVVLGVLFTLLSVLLFVTGLILIVIFMSCRIVACEVIAPKYALYFNKGMENLKTKKQQPGMIS